MVQPNAEAQLAVLKLVLAIEQRDLGAFYALWDEDRTTSQWKLIAGQAVKLFWDLWLTEANNRRSLVNEYLAIGTAEEEMKARIKDAAQEAADGHDAGSLEWVLTEFSPAITREPLGGR
jgi:hypothetical protein